MKRYHFHVFDGRGYQWDGAGLMLPDLGRVVEQAEAKARQVIGSRPDVHDWVRWKVDVRDADDITMFFYPFEEVPRRMREPSGALAARSREPGLFPP
jgi:hypothetical protein